MIYDITPPISPCLQVWPGDTPLTREVLLDMKRGDNITLSSLRATVHLGAHADAPSHYDAEGAAIDQRELSYYLGPCQVIRVAAERGSLVSPEAIQTPIHAERILLATDTFPDPTQFNEDFAALSSALVDMLHGAGVCLIGIDTPSVDLFASRELLAHKTMLRYDMAILEGLALDGVPEGIYELVALPLKLVGFDASPVRAVLRTLPRALK